MSSTITPAINPNLPIELTKHPYWVFWKWDQRNGDWTKVPYDPHTGGMGSSTDPSKWASYDQAVTAMHEYKGSGVGVVMSEDTLLAGIDLDGCIDQDTGKIDPAAQAIVDECPTYWETSPSGTGLRGVLYGLRPGLEENTDITPGGGKLEMYDGRSSRFLTITGDHLADTPHEVCTRPKEFADIYSRFLSHKDTAPRVDISDVPTPPIGTTVGDVVGKLSKERDTAKFDKLFWDGDTSDYDNDESRADGALIRKVVFYTGGDVDLAEQVMRRSKLARPKWDEKRGDTTWLRKDIQNGIQSTTEFYGAFDLNQYSTPHEKKEMNGDGSFLLNHRGGLMVQKKSGF